ncbi:MAG: beta-lactamase family protein [Erysipelotrichaceae bacterium]|nr:beta-lactamase family protein [Erysipelotrichaceae bacterium]
MIDYPKLQELDTLLSKCIDEGVTPGMCVSLVTPEEKWTKCYGNRQIIPSMEPATLDTIWDLASCSKVISTATCIMKLVEEGILTLDTKISEVFPDFSEKEITIKQCITHSSGLPADINGYKAMSKEEMIYAALHVKQEEEWINKVHYSDVNFILLGMIIAHYKGSLDAYAKEVLFDPLQMINTTYNPSPDVKDRCASYEDLEARGGIVRGVVHDGKAYKLGGVSGHAGVFSTIDDLTHYVEMMLNDGIWHGKRFFKEETIKLYKTCLTEGMNERRSVAWVISDPNYALGKNFSEHTLYHTGFSGPSIIIDFDRKMGLIVLANRVHPSRNNTLILTARNDIHDAAYACVH